LDSHSAQGLAPERIGAAIAHQLKQRQRLLQRPVQLGWQASKLLHPAPGHTMGCSQSQVIKLLGHGK
jgi:hypothetical protein